jgi:hypothetical protein
MTRSESATAGMSFDVENVVNTSVTFHKATQQLSSGGAGVGTQPTPDEAT